MYKIHDFKCNDCNLIQEHLIKCSDAILPLCVKCGGTLHTCLQDSEQFKVNQIKCRDVDGYIHYDTGKREGSCGPGYILRDKN